MLFIDQPNQVGLGYDVLRNGTQDLTDRSGDVLISDFGSEVPEQNTTFLVGTFPSQLEWASANGTENAARSLWHFAQVWFQTFPNYKPNDNRISLWTESYGGHYGPAFVNFFQEQNEKIANGTWTDAGETYEMHLDTLGIINGCIDSMVQETSYPEMAYNNTYGIQAINQSTYEQALDAWSAPGGLKELIQTCRRLAAEGDPTNQGGNATVNAACSDANIATNDLEGPYFDSGRGYYDIAAVDLDPFPRNFYVGYLNQPHVQQALGARINFTNPGGNGPYYAFQDTGDYPRGGFMEDIGQLVMESKFTWCTVIATTLVTGLGGRQFRWPCSTSKWSSSLRQATPMFRSMPPTLVDSLGSTATSASLVSFKPDMRCLRTNQRLPTRFSDVRSSTWTLRLAKFRRRATAAIRRLVWQIHGRSSKKHQKAKPPSARPMRCPVPVATSSSKAWSRGTPPSAITSSLTAIPRNYSHSWRRQHRTAPATTQPAIMAHKEAEVRELDLALGPKPMMREPQLRFELRGLWFSQQQCSASAPSEQDEKQTRRCDHATSSPKTCPFRHGVVAVDLRSNAGKPHLASVSYSTLLLHAGRGRNERTRRLLLLTILKSSTDLKPSSVIAY